MAGALCDTAPGVIAHAADRPPSRWRRFARHRVAVVSAVALAAATGVCVASLPFSARWYDVQSLDTAVRHAPSATPAVAYARFVGVRDAVAGPHGVEAVAYGVSSWLGHDDLGRSVVYRLLPGFVVSLAIGLAAAGVALMIGVPFGSVAALAGGRVDAVMMRVVDGLYGLPYLLMVILLRIALTGPLTAVFGDSVRTAQIVILLVAIGGVSWLTPARVVRGQVLSLRSRAFVEAARAAGAGPMWILRRHVLPNLVGPVVVYGSLVVPQAILQEAFLSYLGLGVQQPIPSLGRLAADGVEAVNTFVAFWWLLVFPCGALVLTLLALNFIGDGLRDALDPGAGRAGVG